jgi:hypothetical protein
MSANSEPDDRRWRQRLEGSSDVAAMAIAWVLAVGLGADIPNNVFIMVLIGAIGVGVSRLGLAAWLRMFARRPGAS